MGFYREKQILNESPMNMKTHRIRKSTVEGHSLIHGSLVGRKDGNLGKLNNGK